MRTRPLISGKAAGGLLASALLAMSISAAHAATYIYGTPTSSVAQNRYYGFQAWATDNDHRPVTYGIKNKPAWATFDTRYGHLYGVPTAANVGSYKNIVVYASDGVSQASLPAFNITVTGPGSTGGGGTGSGGSPTPPPPSPPPPPPSTQGSATVSWMPPTQNTNGTTLTNLAGYTISYGTNSKSLTSTVKVANAGLTTYVVEGLASGTYYFAVSAYNSSGATSALSGVVSKTIR
jgi:hypothetical protein